MFSLPICLPSLSILFSLYLSLCFHCSSTSFWSSFSLYLYLNRLYLSFCRSNYLICCDLYCFLLPYLTHSPAFLFFSLLLFLLYLPFFSRSLLFPYHCAILQLYELSVLPPAGWLIQLWPPRSVALFMCPVLPWPPCPLPLLLSPATLWGGAQAINQIASNAFSSML